jgi:serine/threonine protein kinase
VRVVADAVAFAHDAGVVHRDIKPANVLLHPAPPGSEPLLAAARGGDPGLSVKLGDFGLGKVHEEIDGSDPLTQLTRTGSRIGTPAWMAPEQVDPSLGAIGHATDIHALGLLLDRLLTGRPLRGGGTDTEIYRQVLIDEPVPADRVAEGFQFDQVDGALLAEHHLQLRPGQVAAPMGGAVEAGEESVIRHGGKGRERNAI